MDGIPENEKEWKKPIFITILLYWCKAEFEFGGLPSWLLADRGIQLRCSDPTFLVHVDKFMHKLLDMLAPYQYSKGWI